MRCAICGIEIDSIEEGINEGWIPYFYEGETEHGPVCPSCSEDLLRRAYYSFHFTARSLHQ
jgi:hypothetical protein